jgi:hypothetical protein
MEHWWNGTYRAQRKYNYKSLFHYAVSTLKPLKLRAMLRPVTLRGDDDKRKQYSGSLTSNLHDTWKAQAEDQDMCCNGVNWTHQAQYSCMNNVVNTAKFIDCLGISSRLTN